MGDNLQIAGFQRIRKDYFQCTFVDTLNFKLKIIFPDNDREWCTINRKQQHEIS